MLSSARSSGRGAKYSNPIRLVRYNLGQRDRLGWAEGVSGPAGRPISTNEKAGPGSWESPCTGSYRHQATVETWCPGSADTAARPSIDYLGQIARAADNLGFDAVLTPTGTWCEDAWLVTSALSQHTDQAALSRCLPSRHHQPHARRPAGSHLSADDQRPPLDQHRDRRRCVRAAAIRRLALPRRALRPDRRVPEGAAGVRGAARPSTSRAGTTRSGGRPPWRRRTRCPRCTSEAPRASPRTLPPGMSTSTCCGANHRRWPGSGSRGSGTRRRRRVGPSASACVST